VVEIGAGTGRLTGPLAQRAGFVTAVELDPMCVEHLTRMFARASNVRIVHGDVMRFRWPNHRWRAFGNIPFALTTPILRRLLDDLDRGPTRADLLVQFEAARKRASVDRGTLVSLAWLPWWELRLTRRIPRSTFDPPPAVDAGLLTITRRKDALLEPALRPAFQAMLRSAFDRGSSPVRRSLGRTLPPKTWKHIARDRGLPVDARPPELDVWDWVAVFRAT
jgi:23S rRNA (adenine-N6)-dimethyltransferase